MANALLKSEVIKVQNSNRSKYKKLVNNSTFKKTFMRPVAEVDPETAYVERLKAMSPEEMKAELERLAKLASTK